MKITQGRPKRAQTVAVATPCWPAPVSAMIRVLPMRIASRIWPTQLLILCAPVWFSSSRLNQTCAPPRLFSQARGEIERAGAADIMFQQVVKFGLERRIDLGRLVLFFQVENQRHQRFGDVSPAKLAEMAPLVYLMRL
jgi:hypothetical protein